MVSAHEPSGTCHLGCNRWCEAGWPSGTRHPEEDGKAFTLMACFRAQAQKSCSSYNLSGHGGGRRGEGEGEGEGEREKAVWRG